MRRGFFVVQTSHCSSDIKGGGAAFLLSMLTGNEEDLNCDAQNVANVWRGQNQAGK